MLALFIFVSLVVLSGAVKTYPVPIPKGGRFDVHGWLILPIDQNLPANDTSTGIQAWFSHHVPEFWTDSPHNWQLIVKGTIFPTPCVHNDLYPLAIPHPPTDEFLTFEYSFTPPSPFSLNDLLSGSITSLNGVYFNGSFDTPYERIPQSLATVRIDELTTAVYLSEFETVSYKNLQYLAYPRGGSSSRHFYFAHDIHAQPDFDHVVHGTVDQCTSGADNLVYKAGAAWEIVGTPNTLEHKLKAGDVVKINYVHSSPHHKENHENVSCVLTVLESLHCMIGPGFMDNC